MGRGRAQKSTDIIKAMHDIAQESQPFTGRGVGYKLFSLNMILSMDKMPTVYRLLKEAREEGIIPWHWIVDETRALEQTPTWDNPAEYMRDVSRWYRRDFWQQQPERRSLEDMGESRKKPGSDAVRREREEVWSGRRGARGRGGHREATRAISPLTPPRWGIFRFTAEMGF